MKQKLLDIKDLLLEKAMRLINNGVPDSESVPSQIRTSIRLIENEQCAEILFSEERLAIGIPSPSSINTLDIGIDFSNKNYEDELVWDKLVEENKLHPSCNGHCLASYDNGPIPCDNPSKKCIYCGYKKYE